jgi:hypothetical protein
MGILVGIGKAVKITEGVASILEKLSSDDLDRSVVVEVQNHTERPLKLAHHFHSGGGFAEPPNQEIPPGMVELFGSQDRGFLTGTSGGVVYKSDLDFRVHLDWNNPFAGSNDCSGRTSGEKAAAYGATAICGSGNHAHMKYEIRQIINPDFVRSPDYVWTRLHGYAVSPATSELHRQSFEWPLVPLHSWWSRSRGDNWATTNQMYTSPLIDDLSPDYRHYRLEGYIISPDVSPVPDRVLPLHSWWSPGLKDNFATTWPGWTQPIVREVPPDFVHYRLEGYLFSPAYPAPTDTVPINHWLSQSRGDNFITSQEVWRPSWRP